MFYNFQFLDKNISELQRDLSIYTPLLTEGKQLFQKPYFVFFKRSSREYTPSNLGLGLLNKQKRYGKNVNHFRYTFWGQKQNLYIVIRLW